MTEHEVDQERGHTYDGISEYDNRLPNWWLFTLFGSIVFAVAYWLVFHTFGIGSLPMADYKQEMAAATEAQLALMAEGGVTNQSLELMATLDERVASGKKIFRTNCVSCHELRGEGNIGPNLTDRHWIHGGQPIDIYRTVTEGVPEKGMISWANQLGPRRIQDVTAYVLTLRNMEIPGKAPEGDVYIETLDEAEPGDIPVLGMPESVTQ